MFDNVNLSKFRVPAKQKGFLHRARLIDWMHENIHRKLTFISAPAGFGKTSLLVDFASDVEGRVCWFLVTPGDQDLRKFAWDMVLSIRECFPEFGQEIESYLKTTQGSVDHVSLANDFINEMLNCIDDYCLLFVDDYHLVADSDEVTGFFELLLDYLPDGVRMISASRTEFGVPTGKLYARNQINLMNVDQLRFRAKELQELIGKAYRIKLTDEEAHELAQRSDGWIVAVMLAANSMKLGRLMEFQGATDYVYSFLAQEVIERESDTLQQFMLAMSTVDEFDMGIAGALFLEGPAEHLTLELERRNLFVSRVETNDGAAFRFHQLFLEFLRHRLEASNYSRQQELHRRAAKWFEAKHDWDNAIHHYLELGDRESAARLMDYVAKHHFVFGANVRVENWLDILRGPPDLRALAPELLLNRAKFLVDQNRLSEAEDLLEIADTVFESSAETDKILNSLGVRGIILWRRGEYDAAYQVVQSARDILNENVEKGIYPARSHQLDRIESLCDFSRGESDQAIEKLQNATRSLSDVLDDLEDRVLKIQIAHDLVVCYESLGFMSYRLGRIYDSQSHFLEAFSLREKYLRNYQGIIFSLNNIGYIYFQLGDFEKAYRYLTHGMQVMETVERGQASVHLHCSYADLMRELDEWDEAEKLLEFALKLGEDAVSKKKDLDVTSAYQSYLTLERFRGNYDKAIVYLHEIFRLQKRSKDSPEFYAQLGAIYFSMGQMDLAIDTLNKANDQFDQAQQVNQLHATVDYLLACAHFRRSSYEEAKSLFKKALDQIARMGYDQFIIAEARRTIDFLRYADEEMTDLAQIRSLFKRVNDYKTGRAQLEVPEPVKEDSPVDAIWLEVSGFGRGRIRLNDMSIKKSDWRANMARSLFYYILDRSGETGSQIKLQFWPDKTGPKATSNFQSTLWRARKALQGLNIIVIENNRYVISPDVKIWYDVHEFENIYSRAKRKDISESERLNLLKSAVELVGGEFLPDIYMEWANERRIQLQRMYQEILEDLGLLLYLRGRYEQAVQHFEQLLQIDPFRDDIQLVILRSYKELGSVSIAISRFKEYEKFLASEGLLPSEELETYFLTLVREIE